MMRKGLMRVYVGGAGSVACALVAGASASAQISGAENMFQRDRNVSVWQRERPEYDAGPVQNGAFLFYPNLNLGLEMDDNIFATSGSEESDTIAIFNPNIDVETTWSRHALMANASVTRREYFDFGDESVWNANVGASARIDVVRDAFFQFGGNYSALTEPRTSAGAAGQAAEPIEYDTSNLFLSGERAVNRIKLQGSVDLRQFDYDDAPLFGGGIADQDFRDRDELVYTVRGDYAVSPDTALFARARFNTKDYDLAPPNVPLQRDSDGYTLDVGADFDIGGVARGVVGVGYTEQSYDDPTLPDASGASLDVAVEWFPSQLTTITATASRGIQESAVVNSGGFMRTSGSLRVDHEVRRNWILTAEARYGDDDYEGVDRSDERIGASLMATWFVNRNVGVRAYYDYSDQDSSGAAGLQDYTRNVIGVGFTIRP
jgi:hypothetical protein